MSRPNLARLEPSAYAVLSVADPAKVATKTEQVLGELDLDHLCRLLIRSERSLSLVNRRSFAAALADVPPIPNQALRPAPPFPEAVAVAREDGKLLERTRLFLAQNPRVLEELTPELTLALLRHFDPSMRMRPSPFTRHIVAVGSVTVIALLAAILGIVHTQQNEAIISVLRLPSAGKVAHTRTAAPVHQVPASVAVAAVPLASHSHYDNDVAVIAGSSAVTAVPATTSQVSKIVPPAQTETPAPVYHARAQASAVTLHHTTLTNVNGPALFIPVKAKPLATIATSLPSSSATSVGTPVQPQGEATTHTQVVTPSVVSAEAATTTSATTAADPVTAQSSQDNAAATALVLRTIVSQNPNADVEWIRASKANEQVVTVTSRVHHGDVVSDETYHLWNSHGSFTVINHESSNTTHTPTP